MSEFTKEEKDHSEWMVKKYCKILGDVIHISSATETIINLMIGRLISKDHETALDVIRYLVYKMKFANKLTLLAKLLRDKRKEIFLKYEKDIESMETVYDHRNKLAHSSLLSTTKYVKKMDKTRIPINIQESPQPVFIGIRESQDIYDELMRLNDRFSEMKEDILTP